MLDRRAATSAAFVAFLPAKNRKLPEIQSPAHHREHAHSHLPGNCFRLGGQPAFFWKGMQLIGSLVATAGSLATICSVRTKQPRNHELEASEDLLSTKKHAFQKCGSQHSRATAIVQHMGKTGLKPLVQVRR